MSRELDAEVAEKGMGIEVEASPNSCDPKITMYRFKDDCIEIPHYSTVVGAAFQVVEKMREYGGMKMEQRINGGWAVQCPSWIRNEKWVTADTLPEAICRAALSALASKKGDAR